MHHCASLRGPAQQVLAGCRLVQVYKIILPSLWPFFKQQNKQTKKANQAENSNFSSGQASLWLFAKLAFEEPGCS